MRTLKQVAINMADAFTRFGLWKGGGSGGSSALSEMSDVTFTNLQANDVLKYNGSVWVNDNNLHEYSTEEKVIGKWIDGRYVYEKIVPFSATLNSNVWTSIPEVINDKEILIKVCGINPLYAYSTLFGNIDKSLYSNVQVWNMRNYAIDVNYILIQYVKSE